MNTTGLDKAITEEVAGLIERVTFHNDENGFCALRGTIACQSDFCRRQRGALPWKTAIL